VAVPRFDRKHRLAPRPDRDMLRRVCRWMDDRRLLTTELYAIDDENAQVTESARIFADLAGLPSRPWQLYNALLNAEHFGVMDRLLFGSGFPQETPARAIETLYSLNTFSQGTQLPSVPRAHIREIVERDSLALLGLDHLVTGANPGGRMTVETFPGGADRPTPSIPSPHEPRR